MRKNRTISASNMSSMHATHAMHVSSRSHTAAGAFGAQRCRVQFTASQEYVELLEEARDLLTHAVPNRASDEVHVRALRLLVAELKKRKYALPAASRSSTLREDDICAPNCGDATLARATREAGREATQLLDECRAPPHAPFVGVCDCQVAKASCQV
jgi:hypothetical protein